MTTGLSGTFREDEQAFNICILSCKPEMGPFASVRRQDGDPYLIRSGGVIYNHKPRISQQVREGGVATIGFVSLPVDTVWSYARYRRGGVQRNNLCISSL